MSHAEYAPKRLPVLTRLAMALRQIPAVEFALSKFRTLLRGRTNEELPVAGGLLPPTSDMADEVVAKEPVEPDTATVVATAELAEKQAEPEIQVEPEILREHVEAGVTDAVAADAVERDASETPPVDLEATADDTADLIVEADEIGPVATATDDLAQEETDLVGHDAPPIGEAIEAPAIAAEAVETGPAEPSVASIETIAAPVLIVDDIAAPEAAPVAPTVEEPEPVAVATEVAIPDALGAREALVRRRWKETGIMMWRGVGQSTLCIQGSTALLPPKPGETMPQYDRLEFRLIDGIIVCEGFVVEPPVPLKNRSFARAA